MHRRWVFQRGQPANACRKPRIGLADERAEILRIALDFREQNGLRLPQPQKRLDHCHRDSPPLLLRRVALGNLDIARKVILEIRHRRLRFGRFVRFLMKLRALTCVPDLLCRVTAVATNWPS